VKIIKIIKTMKNLDETTIRSFLTRNLPQEMLNGLAYDDPETIRRALRWLGLDSAYEDIQDDEQKTA
jgi:hypothetical protein